MKLITDRSAYTAATGGSGDTGGGGGSSGAGTWAAGVPLLASELRGVYGYHRYVGLGPGGSQGSNDPWETPKEHGTWPINIPVQCRPNAGLFHFELMGQSLSREPSVAYSASTGWCQNAYAGWEVALGMGTGEYSAAKVGGYGGMSGTAKSWAQSYFSKVAAAQDANPGRPKPTIRFASEFNGSWTSKRSFDFWIGKSSDYVQFYINAWRNMWQVAKNEGADMLWLWAPVSWRPGGNSVIVEPDAAYPGDYWVDIVGVDWYAREYESPTFDFDATVSLSNVLERIHNIAPSKPLSLGETGVYRTTTSGRAADFTEYFATLQKYRVSRINYFFVYTYYEAPDDYRFRTQEEINAWNDGVANWLGNL